jgi:hypothetical protein
MFHVDSSNLLNADNEVQSDRRRSKRSAVAARGAGKAMMLARFIVTSVGSAML